MKRVGIKELAPGMQLGEDLFFQRGGLGVPLFSRGVQLTEKSIGQIQRFFSTVTSILVQDDAAVAAVADRGEQAVDVPAPAPATDAGARAGARAGAERASVAASARENEEHESPIAAQQLVEATFDKQSVDALISATMRERPEFQYTKAKFTEYFSQVGGLLQSFSNSGTLDQQDVAELARQVTSEFHEAPQYFDPSLLYLVQIEDWDQGTFNHSFDVAVLTLLTASRMTDQFEELTALFIAGLLHDVGKFIYSKYQLNDMDYIVKKPGGLTAEEYEQIKRHVDVEDYVAGWFEQLPTRLREHIIYGILEHHERFNGSGYLKGKSGTSISFSGRLIGVVDVYDALTRRRAYKSMVRPDDAMHLLHTMADRELFDRKIHKTFFAAMGRYPVGSVVNTSQGVAVVCRQDPRSVESPVVVFSDSGEEVSLLGHESVHILSGTH